MPKTIEELASVIVDTAYHLHQDVGPGLLESVYEKALGKRLESLRLSVSYQQPVPVIIDGVTYPDGYRADLIVEQRQLVEIKSVERLTNLHFKQALTYVRMLQQPLLLLINFGGMIFKDNIKRIMNDRALKQ